MMGRGRRRLEAAQGEVYISMRQREEPSPIRHVIPEQGIYWSWKYGVPICHAPPMADSRLSCPQFYPTDPAELPLVI